MLVLPKENNVLIAAMQRFTNKPGQGAERTILNELQHGRATLFVKVVGQKGAPGEPPITAADLSLLVMEDGRSVRMIIAATGLMPEGIAPELAREGIFIRPVRAPELLRMCKGWFEVLHSGGISALRSPFGSMSLVRPYFPRRAGCASCSLKSDTLFQYPPVVSPRLAERSPRLPSVRSISNHPK